MLSLILIKLHDERKPLEPEYPSVSPSKAGSTYTKGEVKDLELERLLHAPPRPCYIGLKNNVATRLLETTLNKFPPSTEDFVSHSVLKNYIEDTAARTEVDAITQYNTEARNVSKKGDKWAVQTATLQISDNEPQSLNTSTSDFDAVVVASDHYHAARVPDILGLTDWKRAYPQRVQHSKSYRRPEDFHGKSGQKLCAIHQVIFCTGYHIALPFLPQFHADDVLVEKADGNVFVTDGTMLHNLHKDIFYIPDTKLAFVGVPFFTATFTLFEFRAMVVAKVFAGDAGLPREEEVRREYVKRVEKKGYGKGFHSLRDGEVEYVDELLGWVNGDLVGKGKRALRRHTGSWKVAKEEQVQRIRALFAAPRGQEREVRVTCQSVGPVEA